MHAVAVPKGVCWSCCPSISNALLPLLEGRAHIYIVGFQGRREARKMKLAVRKVAIFGRGTLCSKSCWGIKLPAPAPSKSCQLMSRWVAACEMPQFSTTTRVAISKSKQMGRAGRDTYEARCTGGGELAQGPRRAMRVCYLSCVVVLFEGFVSWQRVSVACFPPG